MFSPYIASGDLAYHRPRNYNQLKKIITIKTTKNLYYMYMHNTIVNNTNDYIIYITVVITTTITITITIKKPYYSTIILP